LVARRRLVPSVAPRVRAQAIGETGGAPLVSPECAKASSHSARIPPPVLSGSGSTVGGGNGHHLSPAHPGPRSGHSVVKFRLIWMGVGVKGSVQTRAGADATCRRLDRGSVAGVRIVADVGAQVPAAVAERLGLGEAAGARVVLAGAQAVVAPSPRRTPARRTPPAPGRAGRPRSPPRTRHSRRCPPSPRPRRWRPAPSRAGRRAGGDAFCAP
jgi:hypothetical protein